MGRFTMFLLCLIAALSGTPLRQAEAADDFARSMAESGQGDVIEMIDGGVGDDSGETILKAGSDAPWLPLIIALAAADSTVELPPASLLLSRGKDRRGVDRYALLSAGFVRRHAWLQCFLF